MRDFCSGILHVHVGEGTKLRNPEGLIKIDPYLTLKFGDDISTSDVHRKAGSRCNFDWKVQFPFNVDMRTNEQHALEISVWDDNTGRPDLRVGKAVIEFGDMLKAHGREHSFREKLALTYKGPLKLVEYSGGFVVVELWWEERTEFMPFPVPCLRLIKNKNHGGGLLRGLVDGGTYDILRTWQIPLWGAKAIFQNQLCGWNQNYSAAQQIYGPTPECLAIREVIHVQHHMFYSSETKFGTCSRKHVRGLQEFLDALPDHDINTSVKKTIRFTYVVNTESQMNFSVTSSMTGRDFLSKHALHANAAENVLFAGEFFVDRKSSHQVRWVIDNNSGTFAPPKEKLPLLQELLEFNFGTKVPILVLDRSDPLLKELCLINNVE